jgi:peroxiredoxin
MAAALGEPVEDFTLLRPDGTSVRLSDFPANALVLIFLRHLA